MGGSVNARTVDLLKADDELRGKVACVETRKCVMPVPRFLMDGALGDAFAVEEALLALQLEFHGAIADAARARVDALRTRV